MLNRDTPTRREAAAPVVDPALAELLAALGESPPRIPSKWFYDERGSALFERICALPEYYPTRTETAILRRHAPAIAAALGPNVAVVEYGSGSSVKTELLLAALARPRVYVPVDVSRTALTAAAGRLRARFPTLPVAPLAADFTAPLAPPAPVAAARRRVAFFPGSTIGNFPYPEAVELLAGMRRLVGPGGAAVVGADLAKPRAVLEAAYDDAAGVTAEFNRNALLHLNRRFDADFAPARWAHRAPWREDLGRVEMHLVSRAAQRVRLAGQELAFAPGDHVVTEYSHKYRPGEFEGLAAAAGWRAAGVFTDERGWFSVHLLEA